MGREDAPVQFWRFRDNNTRPHMVVVVGRLLDKQILLGSLQHRQATQSLFPHRVFLEDMEFRRSFLSRSSDSLDKGSRQGSSCQGTCSQPHINTPVLCHSCNWYIRLVLQGEYTWKDSEIEKHCENI